LGRGVADDGPMTSSLETVMANGEFTGRKAAAIATKQKSILAAILRMPVTLLPLRRVTLRKRVRKMPVGVRRPGRTGTTRSRSGNRYPRLYSAVGTALFALVCANNLAEAEKRKTMGRTQRAARFGL
jgi:hypothetical protein